MNPTDDQNPDDLAQGRNECKKYVDRFGEVGARWFAQGVPYVEALERMVELLQRENRELRQRSELQGSEQGEQHSVKPTGNFPFRMPE